MSSPAEQPWERALSLATRGLGRGARVMLDIETRSDLIDVLRKAQDRAQDEGRLDEYGPAAEKLVRGLVNHVVENVPPATEIRHSDSPQASISVLPPQAFGDALRSVCPLWPFC